MQPCVVLDRALNRRVRYVYCLDGIGSLRLLAAKQAHTSASNNMMCPRIAAVRLDHSHHLRPSCLAPLVNDRSRDYLSTFPSVRRAVRAVGNHPVDVEILLSPVELLFAKGYTLTSCSFPWCSSLYGPPPPPEIPPPRVLNKTPAVTYSPPPDPPSTSITSSSSSCDPTRLGRRTGSRGHVRSVGEAPRRIRRAWGTAASPGAPPPLQVLQEHFGGVLAVAVPDHHPQRDRSSCSSGNE